MSIDTTISENIAFSNQVSPSEQLITLTIDQLQELLTRAVDEAIEPLKVEVESTRAIITCQAEKITTLEATVNTLGDNQFIQLRLIGQLREATKKEVQPLQKHPDHEDMLVWAGGDFDPEMFDKEEVNRLLSKIK